MTKLRSFLDSCNASGRHIPNFARITNSLNNKICKNQPQAFDDLSNKERTAMRTLQERMVLFYFLSLPCAKGWYMIYIYIWHKQVGVVFLQEQPDGILKKSDVGQNLLHNLTDHTIRPSTNASQPYGPFCSGVLNWRESDLPFDPTILPFYLF